MEDGDGTMGAQAAGMWYLVRVRGDPSEMKGLAECELNKKENDVPIPTDSSAPASWGEAAIVHSEHQQTQVSSLPSGFSPGKSKTSQRTRGKRGIRQERNNSYDIVAEAMDMGYFLQREAKIGTKINSKSSDALQGKSKGLLSLEGWLRGPLSGYI